MDDKFIIRSETELEAVIGAPMDFVKAKIQHRLDDAMKEFIRHSPLVFVSTIDVHGQVDVSPKGDPNGFVQIDDAGNLLIPERLGNRLTFGFRNILRNGAIGLIFVIPNQRETLRVKGVATLHNDPEVLQQLQANGKPALLCTSVEVKECFIHCGKALIRSKLWKPESWDLSTESIGAKQFASLRGPASEEAVRSTQEKLDKSYAEDLY